MTASCSASGAQTFDVLWGTYFWAIDDSKVLPPPTFYGWLNHTAPSARNKSHRLYDHAFASKLFGNIETAPILTIGSGRPSDPLTGFDANCTGAFLLSSRPLGFGRNSLKTGTQPSWMVVLKFFKVREHGKLDFVVESFNLLNHTNIVVLNQFYGTLSSSLPLFATPNKAGIARQLQVSLDFEF